MTFFRANYLRSLSSPLELRIELSWGNPFKGFPSSKVPSNNGQPSFLYILNYLLLTLQFIVFPSRWVGMDGIEEKPPYEYESSLSLTQGLKA